MTSEEIISLTLNSGRSFSRLEAERLLFSAVEPGEVDYGSFEHKHYFYEMRPLFWLSEYLDKVERIKFMGGLARYDGALRFKGEKQFQKIEFTRAVDSDIAATEAVLRKLGLSFDITDIYDRSDHLTNTETLWDQAFRKKAAKNSLTGQYHGVWLAIVFDSYGFDLAGEKSRLDAAAKAFAEEHVRTVNKVFRRLFIMSISGDYIFDSDRR